MGRESVSVGIGCHQVCHLTGTAVETTYYFLILEGFPILQGIYESSLLVL